MSAASKTSVALLRGINLGARNRVAMKDLRALIEELGGENVRTYLQSGNVVFGGRALTEAAIAKGIRESLGVDVKVLVRTKAELAKVVRGNPFAKADLSTLHVTFLDAAPDKARAKKLAEQTFEPDEFEVTGPEVYLRCPNGYGRSKLSNAFLEKQLGVAGTTRNWKTVTALAELAGE
jgi:uncharacterized protein (DUF1697 family)